MKKNETIAKKRILFVCSGNACRSQIAEGWARALAGREIEAFSAGVEAHGLDPAAVAVMSEVGVDISSQRSKSLGVLPNLAFDYVVTLSERAAEHIRRLGLPWQVVNLPCESPVPRVIGASPSLAHYRRTRDQIRIDIETLLQRVLFTRKRQIRIVA
jgi:arsenate reductase